MKTAIKNVKRLTEIRIRKKPTRRRVNTRVYTLIHGDSRSALQTIDPASISLVLTDPPYGRNVDVRLAKNVKILNDHDQSTGQAILDWAKNHKLPTVAFASPTRPWSMPPKTQHLVWDKGPAVGMGDLRNTFKPTWELIQMTPTRLRGKRDPAILKYHITPKDLRDHPCAKPVAMLRYLIEQLTDPGDTVLDPFMGIGSCGLAALQCGRNFVGIEQDAKYFQQAEKNLKNAAK